MCVLNRRTIFVLVAAVLLGVTVARADSLGDGRVGVQPAPPGDPPPACGSLQFTASSAGTLSASCTVTGSAITSITVAVPKSQSNGVLDVVSPLLTDVTGDVPSGILDLPGVDAFLSQYNWSESCGTGAVGSVAVYECTLTAPSQPTSGALSSLDSLLTEAGIINNGQCNTSGFIFGIPVGCSIDFNTPDPSDLLGADAIVDASTNGKPLAPITPEPSTFVLFSIGILAMIPSLVRRIRRPH
ncbi:MAG TPA: hypothetical protein VEJ67_09100 [Candidatus Cybelea sp.]|nr:hypothetical protein [Candidatus Cybelea sp.]